MGSGDQGEFDDISLRFSLFCNSILAAARLEPREEVVDVVGWMRRASIFKASRVATDVTCVRVWRVTAV
jgi:hypothetical protein